MESYFLKRVNTSQYTLGSNTQFFYIVGSEPYDLARYTQGIDLLF